MNQRPSLWGSVSVLIGVIIGITALIRGLLFLPMLLLAFLVWGAWVIVTQYMPLWQAHRSRRQQASIAQSIEDELADADVTNLEIAQTLLRHVNYRISAYLRSCYPNARWEWAVRNPALLAIQGGIGRIRIYGVEDHDYADVELEPQGKLSCSLVRRLAVQDSADGPLPDSSGVTLDPRIWYDQQGRHTLELLIADLDSRGYRQLTLNEDGSICTALDDSEEETLQSAFSSFPPKVYWPQLAKVLEQEGLAATVQMDCVSVAW